MAQPRVVIVGGGFGGINAAKKLGRAPVQVILIDRCNHHLFQPLLYQVATATLSPADVAMPIRHILRKNKNTEVILGEVVGIDWRAKTLRLADSAVVPYDFLILAAGATHSYFGHDEWSSLARGLKSIEDATVIRSKILDAFESAERSDSESEKRLWTTFLIVGAGATGVEMAGAISEISHHVLKGDFRRVRPEMAQIILIEGAGRILSSYPDDLSEKALSALKKLSVDTRLNTLVQGMDKNGVDTNSGRIEGRTIIWAAGVEAAPAANWLGVEADKSGRIPVKKDLSVQDRDGVYVIGDGGLLTQDGHPLPGVAQVAIQQGKFVADLICAHVSNRIFARDFQYRDLGSLATIGRSSAIAQFGRVHLTGWLAWWIWLFVHILNLVGFRAKLSVLLQWAWAYFSWDRGARLITKG